MQNSDLGYFENTREDVRVFLSGKYGTCLDIGCGAGSVSASLLRDGVVAKADGIELHKDAALAAKTKLRNVYPVDLSHSSDGLPKSEYDLVLCLDVLEHMLDPWAALKRVRELMKQEGTLVVSLPNVRNFRVVVPLLLKGDWRYESSGLLDITHLRFFTRKTAIELVQGAGFSIERVESTSRKKFTKSWWADILTLGLFRGFLDFQHVLIARPQR